MPFIGAGHERLIFMYPLSFREFLIATANFDANLLKNFMI